MVRGSAGSQEEGRGGRRAVSCVQCCRMRAGHQIGCVQPAVASAEGSGHTRAEARLPGSRETEHCDSPRREGGGAEGSWPGRGCWKAAP